MLSLVLFCACGHKPARTEEKKDTKAKELFQGIWIDDDNDMVLFRVVGDTIYYADNQNAPVAFQIVKDSLYMYGSEVSHYHIDKQAEHLFWFHSLAGDVIKLHKSEKASDSLFFSRQSLEVIPTYNQVVKRDSVVIYNGTRYRGYVYINPSKRKVVRTSFSEDGIRVDNVYYDNIIHICVYQGKKSLYASDISKENFANIIPESFLEKAILSDMVFTGVTASGFHYVATICTPDESTVCYMIELNIDREGKLSFEML